jgi:type I restriction enzyme, R subunit
MITDINSEDRLVWQTFAEYLHDALGWDSVYAWHHETFGLHGTLGRASRAGRARLWPVIIKC